MTGHYNLGRSYNTYKEGLVPRDDRFLGEIGGMKTSDERMWESEYMRDRKLLLVDNEPGNFMPRG